MTRALSLEELARVRRLHHSKTPIRHIAEAVGVSYGTVWRALNPKPKRKAAAETSPLSMAQLAAILRGIADHLEGR